MTMELKKEQGGMEAGAAGDVIRIAPPEEEGDRGGVN